MPQQSDRCGRLTGFRSLRCNAVHERVGKRESESSNDVLSASFGHSKILYAWRMEINARMIYASCTQMEMVMSFEFLSAADRTLLAFEKRVPASRIQIFGRSIALAGVVLPLFLIGLLKFTAFESEALRPLITATPWLSWLYAVFGVTGASALLGVVELFTAALLVLPIWIPRAGVLGGALSTLTFATTVSILFAVPIWEDTIGGFPWINATGQFLLKDVALLGISMAIFADGLSRMKLAAARL